MLYGPPGTGKTELVKAIGDLCGLFAIEPMMMAAEVNKSLVGESEELIRELFTRANHMRHLACIIAMDEIDSAVPKRDDSGGGSQHGADKVSTILGLIGGGVDVANLYMVGATNRREAIDAPIQRRMPVQIYVGFPDHDSRRELLELFLRPKKVRRGRFQGRNVTIEDFFDKEFLDETANLTMNFSGAALKELCQRLLQQWERFEHGETEDSFYGRAFSVERNADWSAGKDGQTAALMHCMRSICHGFNLKVGGRTIPDLLSTDTSMASEDHRRKFWTDGKFLTQTTGLIVIQPDDKFTFQVETYVKRSQGRSPQRIRGDNNKSPEAIHFHLRPKCERCKRYAVRVCRCPNSLLRTHEIDDDLFQEGLYLDKPSDAQHEAAIRLEQEKYKQMEEEDSGIHAHKIDPTNEHILREATYIAKIRKLTRIVFADMSTYLLNNGAGNEQKILEEFTMEVKQVIAPGSRAMLIIDLDSLAGLQFSESEGSMSSKSYSIGSRQLFDAAVGAFNSCRASFPKGEENLREMEPDGAKGESWCVVVIRNQFLMNVFRERTQWPLSARERRLEKEKEEEQREVTCAQCGASYRECDNKDLPGSCTYHPSKPYAVHKDGTSARLLAQTSEAVKIHNSSEDPVRIDTVSL